MKKGRSGVVVTNLDFGICYSGRMSKSKSQEMRSRTDEWLTRQLTDDEQEEVDLQRSRAG